MKTLVITGGHHSSALVVATSLQAQNWDIVWFGHKHSSLGDKSASGEFTDVTAAGITFVDLKAGKLYRSFHPLKFFRIVYGFFQAYFELLRLRLKSDLKGIVSFGGYLAVPTVLAARLLAIPVITHEQTVVTGWANWLIAKLARKVLLTWPQSAAYYPPAKVEIVGLPLRPGLLALATHPQTHSSKKPVIYITGGKQGSHTLNQAVFALLPQLTKNYTLIHQTGQSSKFNDHQLALQFAASHYTTFAYGSDQAISALSQADLVVSRAGAHICYELAILGKPSVLIPIPWSSHNEQLKNAQTLAQAGLAVVLTQDQLSPATLLTAINQAIALKPRRLDLPLDATARIIHLITTELG